MKASPWIIACCIGITTSSPYADNGYPPPTGLYGSQVHQGTPRLLLTQPPQPAKVTVNPPRDTSTARHLVMDISLVMSRSPVMLHPKMSPAPPV